MSGRPFLGFLVSMANAIAGHEIGSGDTAPRRSDDFLRTLAPYREVWVIAHDNPDPDAIAAGWALVSLIETKLAKPARLIAGGQILRAENRHMVQQLGVPITLADSLPSRDDIAVVLIDCDVNATHHLACRANDLQHPGGGQILDEPPRQ